jgi:hypothetical protein
MAGLTDGLYESLLDEDLRDILKDRPELRSVFGKIEADEEPARYAAFLERHVSGTGSPQIGNWFPTLFPA